MITWLADVGMFLLVLVSGCLVAINGFDGAMVVNLITQCSCLLREGFAGGWTLLCSGQNCQVLEVLLWQVARYVVKAVN